MADYFLIVATGIHQGIGENGHAVEGFIEIDCMC
jgi:hypothetical protein